MKFIQLEQKLQLFTNVGKYNETSYWGTNVYNDGVNIIIQNDNDPNFQDVTVDYSLITEPATATIDELTQILRCWILEGIDAIKVFNDTPWILDANCNSVQNVGDILHWRGAPISGGATPTEAYKMIWNFNEQTTALAGWSQVLGLGGGSITGIAGLVNHNGIFRLNCGSTGSNAGTNAITSMRLGGSSISNKPFDGGDIIKMEMMLRWPSFALNSVYSVQYRIGILGDGAPGDFGCFFVMDTKGGSAGALIAVELYPVETVNTGVNIVLGQWYRLGIEMNVVSGIHNYYVDGILVATTSGNISGFKMTPSIAVWNYLNGTTIMTVPHQVDIDYLYIETPGQIIDTLYL